MYNETELILQCQKGDREAFGKLYDHHVKTIYNFIYYKTRHRETAEDLTSQTFLKTLKNIDSVDPHRSFSSWLYKIAQNTVFDHFRTKHSSADIDDIYDLSDDTDIVGSLDNAAEVKKVKKYLEKLSPLERNIVMMRVWEELPYKEIADRVGKSEASCKMMYSRSLQKLRDIAPLALFFLLISRL